MVTIVRRVQAGALTDAAGHKNTTDPLRPLSPSIRLSQSHLTVIEAAQASDQIAQASNFQ